jgi:CheY-like chemotaxis protein
MSKVLIVDDMADVREVFALFLAKHGHTVTQAHNAAEALTLAETVRPEIAVVDMCMPDMDGIELAGKMRQLLPETKVVILSGSVNDELQDRAQSAGARAFLSKTMEIDQIINAIQDACT